MTRALCALFMLIACAPATAQPRLRVIGLAQDGGLPHAGCVCERCDAAREDPAQAAFVASLAIIVPEDDDEGKTRDKVYLIDATPDLRSQLDLLADVRDAPEGRADRAPVDGVFLTHAHMGHYTGLMFFGFEALHTQGLPVWCTPRMGEYLSGNGPWSQLVGMGNIELRKMQPFVMQPPAPNQPAFCGVDGEEGDLVTLLGSGVTVMALKVPHRDELSDTVGFVIAGPTQRVLYVPDTEPWRTWDEPLGSVIERLDIDIAILDGCFYSADELPGRAASEIGHPLMVDTMDELQPLVGAGRVKVLFTHLNHSNRALTPGSLEAQEIVRRGFAVVSMGLEIDL
ncbi:MAG: pyrroloquinoline quinone biosynthesis protein B [Phycisphaerales bacterium]|jgi:pyrroloquinoline quinone biosynthesis protein B